MSITILPLNVLNRKYLKKSSQVKNPKYHTFMSLVMEHICISPIKFAQINLHYALNSWYEDNGYRFIHHTQGNVIFYSTQAIFDEGHFPRYPSSHFREQTPPGRLIPEIELSAPGPFGINVRLANSKARIKPTAPLSAFNKENSIEFSLDFLYYLYNYYMVCALPSHAYHVTNHVTSCGVTMTMWNLWHDTFPHCLLHSKSKIKEKEKKRKEI